MIFFSMSKGTKSFGHDKALACESRGFVYNKKGCIVLTHPPNSCSLQKKLYKTVIIPILSLGLIVFPFF